MQGSPENPDCRWKDRSVLQTRLGESRCWVWVMCPWPQHDTCHLDRFAESITPDWTFLHQVADSRDPFQTKQSKASSARQPEICAVLFCLSLMLLPAVFFPSSDKKRKSDTKQDPKQNKKLKKNRDMKNRKDMKLKRKK